MVPLYLYLSDSQRNLINDQGCRIDPCYYLKNVLFSIDVSFKIKFQKLSLLKNVLFSFDFYLKIKFQEL